MNLLIVENSYKKLLNQFNIIIMRLQAGNIYLFKYFRYRKDKQPLVLILYHGIHPSTGNEIIHGININYLQNSLTEDLIDMMVRIAMKDLDAKNMYRFYHKYMKINMHPIIAKAYRIYLVKSVGYPIPVSRGYNETRNFLKTLIVSKKDEAAKIRTQLRKEIVFAKTNPEEIKKLIKEKPMSTSEIFMSVDNYLNEIQKHTLNKFDKTKYTGLRRRKK